MPYCAVSACRHISNKNNLRNGGISYHRFPHDPDVKEKWTFATGRKQWLPTKLSTICSAHFKDGDFSVKISGNRYLKRGSIPSLDVWMNQTSVELKHVTDYEKDLIDGHDMMCGFENCADYLEKPKDDNVKRIHNLHADYEGQRKKSRHGIDDIIIDYDNIDKFGEQIAFLLKRLPRQLCMELQESIVTLVKTATKEYDSNNKRNVSASTSSKLHESPDLPLGKYNEPVEEIMIKVEPFDMQIEAESSVNESVDEIKDTDAQTESPLKQRVCANNKTIPVEVINMDYMEHDILENDNDGIRNTDFFDSDSFI